MTNRDDQELSRVLAATALPVTLITMTVDTGLAMATIVTIAAVVIAIIAVIRPGADLDLPGKLRRLKDRLLSYVPNRNYPAIALTRIRGRVETARKPP